MKKTTWALIIPCAILVILALTQSTYHRIVEKNFFELLENLNNSPSAHYKVTETHTSIQDGKTSTYTYAKEYWFHNDSIFSTWESDDEGKAYLKYGNQYFTKSLDPNAKWQKNIQTSFGTCIWNSITPELLSACPMEIKKSGSYTDLIFTEDLGSMNCTFSRQVAEHTFRLNKNQELISYQFIFTTYNSQKIDASAVHSVEKKLYGGFSYGQEVIAQIDQQYALVK